MSQEGIFKACINNTISRRTEFWGCDWEDILKTNYLYCCYMLSNYFHFLFLHNFLVFIYFDWLSFQNTKVLFYIIFKFLLYWQFRDVLPYLYCITIFLISFLPKSFWALSHLCFLQGSPHCEENKECVTLTERAKILASRCEEYYCLLLWRQQQFIWLK